MREERTVSEQTKSIQLPSGRVAIVRRGTGKDLMHAHRVVAGNPEPIAVSFALIAELAMVEAKALVYEDVLAMDLDDVLVLQAEIVGSGDGASFLPTPDSPGTAANGTAPRQTNFSNSSDSDSVSRN
jgi:hypothetical protein